jgi:hypothetical protein
MGVQYGSQKAILVDRQKKGAVRSIFSFGLAAIVGCGPAVNDRHDGYDAFSYCLQLWKKQCSIKTLNFPMISTVR